eukprot:COSAG01_NODE_4070_length_5382_cov_97.096725_1_plen_92_part_00
METQADDLGPVEDLKERLTTDEEYDYDRDTGEQVETIHAYILAEHGRGSNLHKRAEAVMGNFMVGERFLDELITQAGDTNAELFSSMGQSV